jgi:hypothetical protein
MELQERPPKKPVISSFVELSLLNCAKDFDNKAILNPYFLFQLFSANTIALPILQNNRIAPI